MPANAQYQRHRSHKISSGIAVGQFDCNGNALTSKEVMAKRERKGLCRICGRTRTHTRSIIGTVTQITKEGECLEGWCLKCHTIEQIMEKPGVRAKLEHKNKGRRFSAKGMLPDKHFGKHSSFSSDNGNNVASPEPLKQIATEDSTGSLPNEGSLDSPTTRDSCKEVEDLKSISDIVTKMKKDRKNVTVQETGCLNLAKTLSANASQKELDMALETIIHAMTDHPGAIELQTIGCTALDNLTSFRDDALMNKEMGTKLALNGGVSLVIDAMTLHTTARSLQREAMKVLRNVLRATQRDQNLFVMGPKELEAVVSVMEAHSHSKSIQIFAWQALDIALMNVTVAKLVRGNVKLSEQLTELAKRHPTECSTMVDRVVKASSM